MTIIDVVGAVIREGDRYLVGQRAADKSQGGLWEFMGGKIERGETPEQALARECREELALEIENETVIDSVVHAYPEKTIRLTLIACSPKPGSVPKALEHQQIRWVTPDEMRALPFAPADRDLIDRLFGDVKAPPRLTTLCYIEKDGCWLVLHRTKKQHDENGDKWIGVGGKFEYGESPEECVLREVKEETGLTMLDPRFRGLVTFVSDEWGVEYMHLFTCTAFTGELTTCDEGELVWLPKAELLTKRLWEGDKLFLRALDERQDFFTLKLRYQGETLVEHRFG